MKNKLSFIHEFCMRGFIFGAPIYFILSMFEEFIWSNGKTFSVIMSLCLVLWLLFGLYFFVAILISKGQRERVFSKLFLFRERDEREELISAKAAKSSFLLMAGLLFLSFFMSTSRFGYKPRPAGGYYGEFTMGHIDMAPIKLAEISKVDSELGLSYSYDLFNLPLSNTAIFLVLLAIQFLSFKFFAKKFERRS